MLQKGESVEFKEKVTLKTQREFAKVFDDFTYLHYNDDYGRRVGFNSRVVQGALISCIIVKDIVIAFGDSAILRTHDLAFFKPVYPNQEFTIRLEVLSNIKDQVIKIGTQVLVGDELHYRGTTKIKAFADIQESYFKDTEYNVDDYSEWSEEYIPEDMV